MAAQGKQREGARGPAGPAHPTTVWMANLVDWREAAKAVGCRGTERVAADRTGRRSARAAYAEALAREERAALDLQRAAGRIRFRSPETRR